ncbi:MAG: nuclear transport factor 2 family protein [Bacteroidota bacterium]
MNTPRTLLVVAALLAAPSALAQQHEGMDHSGMDHSQMEGMDHGAMDHDAMMALHQRMMADPEVHAAMKADPVMQALMAEMMPSMDHSGMDHSQMSGMDHGETSHEMPMDADARAAMMARMRERMQAMTPEAHAAFMTRMEAAHRRLMAEPTVHQRMMADPEMRRMMEAMPGGMDHGSMGGMDHGQMQGMDHSDTDHAAGVVMQRRNAGAHNGDERPATPTVGQAEFDASATADRFHAALASGDRATVEALLTPDAVILEGGQAEARAEYLGSHFARDAAFLADAQPEPLFRRTTVAGDAAWVASTQRVRDATMAELLVMTRTPDGWRVAAVHWSSALN